ncbi:MAG: ChaN family lipoprotein [Gemmatimonadetes bacterium]|nr:ChaN family lipoprotein [Gemmatimonadota bacterium]
MNKTALALALIASSAAAQAPIPAPAKPAAGDAPASYVPHRVYDTRNKRFTDFETMLSALIYADVVFLGEQHDDPGTHRLEAATLEGLTRRRGNIVLALEMFERDAQKPLDFYLAGRMTEKDFLAVSRPWPRYDTDYRPLVEFARWYKWPVIAGNIPRRDASLIARNGLSLLDTLNATERAFIAKDLNCPHDAYFDRFKQTMGEMSGHGPANGAAMTDSAKAAQLERIYQSQCSKDETMGESIARALAAAPPRALVLHVNGAFHSDYRQGTAARAQARLKDKQVSVVSFIPVDDLDKADGKSERSIGDYIVFTLKPPATPK